MCEGCSRVLQAMRLEMFATSSRTDRCPPRNFRQISFRLMTAIGSVSFSNKDEMASREIRSACFPGYSPRTLHSADRLMGLPSKSTVVPTSTAA